jgi:hypothetical protein
MEIFSTIKLQPFFDIKKFCHHFFSRFSFWHSATDKMAVAVTVLVPEVAELS